MTSKFQNAVAEALNEQPWYQRRKDTLAAVAGTILQVLNLLVLYTGELPAWTNAVIAAVIGVCQIVVHARTQGAITPSMGERLERASLFAALKEGSDAPIEEGKAVEYVPVEIEPVLTDRPLSVAEAEAALAEARAAQEPDPQGEAAAAYRETTFRE